MYIIRNYGHSMSGVLQAGSTQNLFLSHHSWRGGLADPTYLGAMSDPQGHRMPPAENLDWTQCDTLKRGALGSTDSTHSTPKKRGTHG